MDYVNQELQKLNVLLQHGVIANESYEDKARYLREHGQPPDAGVGMTIADAFPFSVIEMRPNGPAHKTGVIKPGDQLVKVDGLNMTRQLTGAQVRSAVVGPEGSVVELQFQEIPRRTEKGAFRVRLVRQSADKDGVTQVQSGCALPPPAGLPGGSVHGVVYNDDFDETSDGAENAVKHQYDPRKKQWARTRIIVVVQPRPFAEGAMRKAYHMQDLSVLGDDRRYVLKLSKDPNELTQIYFDDVQMQMEAKMYAELYNANEPPKRVDFLDAYVLQLTDRPGKPICAVEKYIEGEYKKFNNNWNWSDEKRNTPQAFSHFTYEKSNHCILVCDIQGVGDTWTDPQIHSHNQEGYGKGNMGQQGIDKFLESHTCNEICRWLKLPSTGRVKPPSAQATRVRPNPENTVARQQPPPPMGGLAEPEVLELARQMASEQVALEKAKMEAELERMRRELEQQSNASAAAAGAGNGAARASAGASGEAIATLCGMGFDEAAARAALERNQWNLPAAVEDCLAASLCAAPEASAGPGAAGRGSGPPLRAPPAQPSVQATQTSRVDVAARLQKEWNEQKACNARDDAVVFAEPLGPSGPALREWVGVILGPPGTVYEGGALQLSLSFPEAYPIQPPVVKFVTKVFHPNVWARPDAKFGQICLDILDDKWSPALRVQKVLLTIAALLQEPNTDSPLDRMVGQMYTSNQAMFVEYAKEYVRTDCFRADDVKEMLSMGLSTRRIVGALRVKEGKMDQALDFLLTNGEWEPSAQDLLSAMAHNAAAARAPGAAGIDASALNRNAQRHQQQAMGQALQQHAQQGLQRAQHERSTQHLPPPAYDAPLPEGWKQYTEPQTGKPYYHHAATGNTQWERPPLGQGARIV